MNDSLFDAIENENLASVERLIKEGVRCKCTWLFLKKT